MIRPNPFEDTGIQVIEKEIRERQEQIDLEEKIVAELDQQLAESKRAVLRMKHDQERAKNKLTTWRMKPVIIGS